MSFAYTGSDARVYPEFPHGDLASLTVNPGDVLDFDDGPPPDGFWVEVTGKPAPEPAPAKAAARPTSTVAPEGVKTEAGSTAAATDGKEG